MKKLFIIIFMLMATVVFAQKTECPINGLYETIGVGWLNGRSIPEITPARLGIDRLNYDVYFMHDSNKDGSFADEVLENMYNEKFFYDGIFFNSANGDIVTFVFDVQTERWLLTIYSGDNTLVIEFILLEMW